MRFESILRAHLTRYPSMQIQDVYKLVHQATMGSEHAMSSFEGARNWMERELAEMGAGPDEPVVDPISEDGQIVRVHLRPFVAGGGASDALLDAFIRTANEYRGDVQALKKYWKIVTGIGYYSLVEMDDFIQSMKSQDYPAVHHSPKYEKLYRPAYRVVWRKFTNFVDEHFECGDLD
jgi:hypothetical protein